MLTQNYQRFEIYPIPEKNPSDGIPFLLLWLSTTEKALNGGRAFLSSGFPQAC